VTVGVATIRRAELAEHETAMNAPNDIAIRRAFEGAGVEFIEENGGGARCASTEAYAEKRALRSLRRSPAKPAH
jgi:hypothetical protein